VLPGIAWALVTPVWCSVPPITHPWVRRALLVRRVQFLLFSCESAQLGRSAISGILRICVPQYLFSLDSWAFRLSFEGDSRTLQHDLSMSETWLEENDKNFWNVEIQISAQES
jgi:hypothetical protein